MMGVGEVHRIFDHGTVMVYDQVKNRSFPYYPEENELLPLYLERVLYKTDHEARIIKEIKKVMRIHPNELDVGDEFWECNSYQGCIKFIVTKKPESTQLQITESEPHTQWFWTATNEHGYEQSFVLTDGLEHYGPSLYRERIYR